ncbi:hypothetical protein Y032_0095g2800 [Ancylostoma ceylanicum]|uniref:Serpentine receptor class gamma n=1 Tax=Ancylostoma ceylanicum TaxID=53326 RepID=A0A016TKJ7_9BILA|nr:hypothetical protein Y032_0095g2800 [Ancylostoma ceylanicum]
MPKMGYTYYGTETDHCVHFKSLPLPFSYQIKAREEMVAVTLVLDMTINAITLLSTILYVYIEIVLFILMKKGDKERMSTYFFLVFYCGLVNILVIFTQVFFRILPNLLWQRFFYSLGSMGARACFMISFGSEMFVILCESFIAISRYLTFAHPDSNRNYWNMRRIRNFLIASSFETNINRLGAGVTFNFKVNNLQWVGTSIVAPLVAATVSCILCTYCYYKVATIIKASITGLSRGVVLKMCLSSLIICFGIFLNLVIRVMNFLSFITGGYDVIPIQVFIFLTKIASLVSVCGTPWILLALFPVVRTTAFPCCKRVTAQPALSVTASSGRG